MKILSLEAEATGHFREKNSGCLLEGWLFEEGQTVPLLGFLLQTLK